MSNEIIQHEDKQQTLLTISQLKERASLVKQALKEVMETNVHYGIVPGCGNKPTLLKAGTEKLCLLFRLSPTFEVTTKTLDENHREYEVLTTLRHISTGEIWAQGVGCCSTKETKYAKRRDGSSNPNPVDVYNTVLKMAKKRSQADAVLTATGASDIFTQDVEDLVDNGVIQPKAKENEKPVYQKIVRTKLPIATTENKFTELQPVHKQKFDEFCAQMQASVNDVELDDIYEKSQDMFSVSTSLTKECIDKTLAELKTVYEFNQHTEGKNK